MHTDILKSRYFVVIRDKYPVVARIKSTINKRLYAGYTIDSLTGEIINTVFKKDDLLEAIKSPLTALDVYVIKRSGHPWIQKNWKVQPYDLFYSEDLNSIKRIPVVSTKPNNSIWLPILVDRLYYCLQLDSLLLKALQITSYITLHNLYIRWYNSRGNDKSEYTIIEQSQILLKFEFLWDVLED